MAKIIFIPDWLNVELQSKGVCYDEFVKDINSVIVSRTDVINYYLAQSNFFKLITELKNPHSDYYSMYSSMFGHNFPDMPELTIVLNSTPSNEVEFQKLVSTAYKADDISLSYVRDMSNTYVIVVGKHAKEESDKKNCQSDSIIWSVIQNLHSGLRVLNGAVDKSSVFRENPILAQLYVQNLCR